MDAIILSSEGRQIRAARQLSGAGAASLAEGRRVSVLVPSDRAVVLAAAIPKTTASRMRTLLPFSLEDHFATDIDAMHFAAGPALADGRITATVVEKTQLEQWLDQLAEAGISPQAVYADCDGVPNTPSTTVLLVDDDAVLGRRPDASPFQLDGVGLAEILTLLEGAEADAADLRHVMIYGDAATLHARSAEIESLRDSVADVDVRELRDGLTGLLAATLLGGRGTNLLQGEYAPKSNLRAAFRPWYAAAGVAAALALITVLGAGIDLLRLRQADAALTETTEMLCADEFGMSLESACRAEVQRRLAGAGQSAESAQESFLSALNVVADAADSAGIDAMSFRNRTLDLDLRVADVEALDRFSQQVAATRRFEVRALSNTPQDDGLRSRVQVVAAP